MSAWREVAAWARTRLTLAAWPGAALVLLVAAGSREVPLALLLVAAFRLLDDLLDLPHDRLAHPARALSRAPSTAPFVAALLALLAACLALTARPSLLAALLALLVAGARLPRAPRHLLVAAKYPALVLLLGGPAAAAVVVGLAFAAHEVLHDPTLRAAGWPTPLLALELLALALALPLALVVPGAALLAWLWARHRRRRPPGPWCHAVLLPALVAP
ncbi:MAG: hypothetical protein M9894_22220 [Planctomycetes bacterium]|nr:hypothetical protein [Planctomycetota bacterium]